MLFSQVWFHGKDFSWTMYTLFSPAQHWNRMRPEQWQIMYHVFVSGGSLATLSEKDNGLDGQWGRFRMAISLSLYSSKYYRNYSEFTVLWQNLNWIMKSPWNLYFSIKIMNRLVYFKQSWCESTLRKQIMTRNITNFLPSR